MDQQPVGKLGTSKGNADHTSSPAGLGTNIVNLSSKVLSPEEKSILEKGLNFIPTPADVDRDRIQVAVAEFGRKVKLAYHFEGGTRFTRPRFMPKSQWTPSDNKIHPNILKRLDEMEKEIKDLRVRKGYPNLKVGELRAIKKLRQNQNIVIKKADKGSATVIMDMEDYVREGNRQLDNPKHYRKLSHPIYHKTAARISKIVQKLKNNGYINEKQRSYLSPPDTPRPRRFYMLPKIHKDPKKWTVPNKIPPGRPIVSDCSSESYSISEYIDYHLRPLATSHPSYLKDTGDFLHKISQVEVPDDALLVTLDVDGLYTNIDNHAGLQAVKQRLYENPMRGRPDKELLELLKISLENNDFEFNDEWYLQVWGTAMGKKFAPHYANIFMAKWEQEALAKCPKKPLVYFRFLDDIFIVWTHSRSDFNDFFQILNEHQASIKLKSEINDTSIDFLDVTLFKGKHFKNKNMLDTKVFVKPTDTHQLLHKKSFHPKHTFSGILKSQFLRFNRICNNQEDFDEACNRLIRALQKRHYSKRFLRRIKSNTLKEIKDQLETGPRAKGKTSKCPITRCGTCLYFDPTSEFENTRDSTKCTIRQNLTCGSENVIYLIRCKKCNQQYVGQTGQTLRKRFTHHKLSINKNTPNPVGKHFNQEDHSLQDCCITPIEQLSVRKDKKDNKFALIKREIYWINRLGTAYPHGMNRITDTHSADIMALVIPYSQTAVETSQIVKKYFKQMQTEIPELQKAKVITAFKRNKNLSDNLVSSKLS